MATVFAPYLAIYRNEKHKHLPNGCKILLNTILNTSKMAKTFLNFTKEVKFSHN